MGGVNERRVHGPDVLFELAVHDTLVSPLFGQGCGGPDCQIAHLRVEESVIDPSEQIRREVELEEACLVDFHLQELVSCAQVQQAVPPLPHPWRHAQLLTVVDVDGYGFRQIETYRCGLTVSLGSDLTRMGVVSLVGEPVLSDRRSGIAGRPGATNPNHPKPFGTDPRIKFSCSELFGRRIPPLFSLGACRLIGFRNIPCAQGCGLNHPDNTQSNLCTVLGSPPIVVAQHFSDCEIAVAIFRGLYRKHCLV